jgi:uncharacterized RDD family membrane protein YckC
MAYAPPTTYDPTNVMGRRIVAWFIDVFIPLAIAIGVGWVIFTGNATKHVGVPSDYCSAVRVQTTGLTCIVIGNDAYVATQAETRHAVDVGGLIWLVGAANLFLLQGLSGAALGKHMLGLRVVRDDGSIAGFGWNALRTLLLVVDQLFCALPGIISASVTHPHRRIGDFAAGTFVVARESVGRPIGAPASAGAYPPPWSAPGGGWGPPPGGQTWGGPSPTPGWGAPNPAPQQGWGAPPAQTPPAQTPPAQSPPAQTPPAQSPPAQSPPAQSPPAATPPIVATPATWGAPAPTQPQPAADPQPQPQPQPEPAPADEPGWAAPTPVFETEPAPAPTPVFETEPAPQPQAEPQPAPTPVVEAQPAPQPQPQAQPVAAAEPSRREPQWDAQRNAWVYWEAETNRWLQHDPQTNTWGPLR